MLANIFMVMLHCPIVTKFLTQNGWHNFLKFFTEVMLNLQNLKYVFRYFILFTKSFQVMFLGISFEVIICK